MFKNNNRQSLRHFLIGLSTCGLLVVAFQNCAKTDLKFAKVNQASSIVTINIDVTEHAIDTKTVSTSFNTQLADRNYLAGVLTDIFGPDSKSIVDQGILLHPDDLGGPCSEYAHYKKKIGTKFVDSEPTMICNEENTTKPMIPPAQAIRQGWIIQTCAKLVGTDSNPPTLNYALGRIKPNASLTQLPAVNTENLVSLHRLFYRLRPLPPDTVLEALKLMFHPDDPTISDWQTAIYSYCISSQWQVL